MTCSKLERQQRFPPSRRPSEPFRSSQNQHIYHMVQEAVQVHGLEVHIRAIGPMTPACSGVTSTSAEVYVDEAAGDHES